MSKHTISMDDATWDAMVERAGRIGLDRDGRALSVSAYLRELHERYGHLLQRAALGERTDETRRCISRGTHDDRHGLCVGCGGDTCTEPVDEQSTRADAQPTGQGGSVGQSGDQPNERMVRAHGKVPKPQASQEGVSGEGEEASPAVCRREGCNAPVRFLNGPPSLYCSASHRLADEQERRR